MLGDRLLNILIVVFIGTYLLGWLILLLSILLQKILPKHEEKIEAILQKIGNICSFIMKYSAIIGIVLFVVRILGEWLGWFKVANPPVIND